MGHEVVASTPVADPQQTDRRKEYLYEKIKEKNPPLERFAGACDDHPVRRSGLGS